MNKKETLFPHDTIRNIQTELISDVVNVIANKKHLIAHAPTGLGKTAAVLAPALTYAMKNDLAVFFLTSRHTQHVIAIDTLKTMKEKHDVKIIAADIIGKKWMCSQDGVEGLYSNEFSDYCNSVKEKGECEFFLNTRKKSGSLTVEAKQIIEQLKELSPLHSEELIKFCRTGKLCPYEVSTVLAADAHVIVADYYHIFSTSIRDAFFLKSKKSLEKSIIIVDEGHNLSRRCRELLTQKLSLFMLEMALKEAKKFSSEDAIEQLLSIKDAMINLTEDVKEERLVSKEEFVKQIDKYDEMIAQLEFLGDEIREKQKRSFIGSVANFLDAWQGQDEAFARILKVSNKSVELLYQCMDPSLLTRDVIDASHSTIVMSGTLTPTGMYKDLLGFSNVVEKAYKSPFPAGNRLSLVVPMTTTKFTRRNEKEFRRIAEILAEMVNAVPGNSAVFFPSYALRDIVNGFFSLMCKKTTFLEEPKLNKGDKNELLERFKSYHKSGAVLLGVASGSFGEGIDLPGDFLKAVIVVGLPLEKPSLETKELIKYYDARFGKGWDYGYIFPAITKTLQNAGRCIRSETDKGVIIFLEERYAWPNYRRCFPPEWDIEITKQYETKISEFFNN